jgi:hypothetical protein
MNWRRLSNIILPIAICIGVFILIISIQYRPARPVSIYSKDIYPRGTYENSTIANEKGNRQEILLQQQQLDTIIGMIKSSDKVFTTELDGGKYYVLNIKYTLSTVQIYLRDNSNIYYVIHNRKYNAACFQINSKELLSYLTEILQDEKLSFNYESNYINKYIQIL